MHELVEGDWWWSHAHTHTSEQTNTFGTCENRQWGNRSNEVNFKKIVSIQTLYTFHSQMVGHF